MRLRPGDVATVLGAAMVVGLAALDAAWGPERVISATVVIGPFLAALLGGPRRTAAVAALALGAAVLSGTWNDNAGDLDYFARLLVVLAGGAFAIVAARSRERFAIDRSRLALLRGAAQIADSAAAIPEVVDAVGGLLVPALADVCVIDVLRDGRPERLGVVARGPDRAGTEERLRRGADLDAVRAGQARLLDPGDGAHRSGLTVPLRSRGRTVGTMTLMAARRTYTPEDREFAQLLAGRVALALENAGMFAELESLEARLTTALGALAEAVTIQDDAAGWSTPTTRRPPRSASTSAEQLLATPPREIVDAYESFHEDGSPLRLEELPGRACCRADAGAAARPRRPQADRRGALAGRQGDRACPRARARTGSRST